MRGKEGTKEKRRGSRLEDGPQTAWSPHQRGGKEKEWASRVILEKDSSLRERKKRLSRPQLNDDTGKKRGKASRPIQGRPKNGEKKRYLPCTKGPNTFLNNPVRRGGKQIRPIERAEGKEKNEKGPGLCREIHFWLTRKERGREGEGKFERKRRKEREKKPFFPKTGSDFQSNNSENGARPRLEAGPKKKRKLRK